MVAGRDGACCSFSIYSTVHLSFLSELLVWSPVAPFLCRSIQNGAGLLWAPGLSVPTVSSVKTLSRVWRLGVEPARYPVAARGPVTAGCTCEVELVAVRVPGSVLVVSNIRQPIIFSSCDRKPPKSIETFFVLFCFETRGFGVLLPQPPWFCYY